jgi:glutamyl-Q tRNA(Asp) synthetase
MAFVTRFAPSPTGPLHLGHAYSAILAHDMARAEGGTFLLRIEDIDRHRAKPEWEAQLLDDLDWLGLGWDADPLRQSTRLPDYQRALDRLWANDLLYPCTCSRRDIELALGAPQEGVASPDGPDGPVYPGTCRGMHSGGLPRSMVRRPGDTHLRLDMGVALGGCDHAVIQAGTGSWGLWFTETGESHRGAIFTDRQTYEREIGDIILARKDFGTSYHLSVVVDDAAQGITHVVRGEDLFEATRIHVLLQRLLGLPTPVYHHHRLIRDDQGKRLAKRDDARALSKYRAEGATPANIRRMVGLPNP